MARPFLRKVPQVFALFWVVKILTTALGESTSDFLVHAVSPYLAVAFGFVAFVVAMGLQLFTWRYIAWIYWLAVAMVAVFGTMAADVLHVGFGIPYAVSTIFFAAALAAVFWLWHRVEGDLSIHSITTRRREYFYWATVLATFALGTAAGDLVAVTFHLGYLGAGLIFAGLFAVPAVAFFKFGLSEVVAFWSAYIVTRPLGASFADWFGKPVEFGGIGVGDAVVSLVLVLLIVACVGYLQFTKADVEKR